jgi:hypothetical protein
MTKFTFHRALPELHLQQGPTAEGSPVIADVVDRVVALAKLSATELAALMGSEEGPDFASLEVTELTGVAPERFLRSWDSIGRASPSALNDQQYDAFLRGENPLAETVIEIDTSEIYGEHLK